jgi:hypothetical protein
MVARRPRSGQALGWLSIVLAVSLPSIGCGREQDPGAQTITTNNTMESSTNGTVLVQCASNADDYIVESAPDGTPVNITAEQANAMLDAPAARAAPTEIRLVFVTIPGSLSNRAPDPTLPYIVGETDDPANAGRSDHRLAWQITKTSPPDSVMYVYGGGHDGGPRNVPDPATCTVYRTVTFIDALTGWPTGTFLLTEPDAPGEGGA